MSHVLTLVAARSQTSLRPATIKRVHEAVAGGSVIPLWPGEAVDIMCRKAPDPAAVEAALDGAAIDVFMTRVQFRRKALLVADMDSTIVTSETLDELAGHAGIGAEVAAITRQSMNGELDFAEALRLRVAMLKGLELAALDKTWARTVLSEGALELVATMRAHHATTALVSGGFTFFTGRVAARVGFDVHRANVLLDDGRVLTGAVDEPILDRDATLAALRELAAAKGVSLRMTLAVGDGANDLAMLRAAGLGVAYHAKPVVAAEARAQVRFGSLRALLFAQGYREGEIFAG